LTVSKDNNFVFFLHLIRVINPHNRLFYNMEVDKRHNYTYLLICACNISVLLFKLSIVSSRKPQICFLFARYLCSVSIHQFSLQKACRIFCLLHISVSKGHAFFSCCERQQLQIT